MAKKRIFSGIQPSGNLHLGNYLGAIKNWVTLQDEYDSFFCIVDYHAITTQYDTKIFQDRILEAAADYIACGIDIEKSTIFVQSHVPAHTELAWLLNTITPMGELERMTQFKDKSKQNSSNINTGLFTYPVLMAADILLYNTALVPVGDDQKQHVELARIIARKFNSNFGDTFTVPEVYTKHGSRIMSLSDPHKKMSKSLGEKHYISLSDSDDVISKKVMKAVTDSGTEISFSEDKPAISNLLTIYQSLTGKSKEETEENFSGKSYGDFKKELSEVVVEYIKPIRKKREELLTDKPALQTLLYEGSEKAKSIAHANLELAKRKMGLLP